MILGVTRVVSLPARGRCACRELKSDILSVGTEIPIGIRLSQGEISCQDLVLGVMDVAVSISFRSTLCLFRCMCSGCGVPLVIPRPLCLVEFLLRPNHGDLRTEPLPLSDSCGNTWCGSEPLCLVKLVSTVMPGLLGRPSRSLRRDFCREARPEKDRELRFVIVRCALALDSTSQVCCSGVAFPSNPSWKCTNICSSPSARFRCESSAYCSLSNGRLALSVDRGRGLSGGWPYEVMLGLCVDILN